MIKLKVLIENMTRKRGILGEHGHSLLIEIDSFKVLFDAGQTDVLSLNAKINGIDLSIVDALILSHGHYDHTGGVLKFCRINKTALIYMHPDAFSKIYNAVQGKPVGNCIGIPWSCQDRKTFENRIVYIKVPTKIHKDILLTGELPEKPNRQSLDFVKRNISGGYEEDRVIRKQRLKTHPYLSALAVG